MVLTNIKDHVVNQSQSTVDMSIHPLTFFLIVIVYWVVV